MTNISLCGGPICYTGGFELYGGWNEQISIKMKILRPTSITIFENCGDVFMSLSHGFVTLGLK